jgi:hypothetical protein
MFVSELFSPLEVADINKIAKEEVIIPLTAATLLLEGIEWVGAKNTNKDGYCVFCKNDRASGHTGDCKWVTNMAILKAYVGV